MWLRKWRGWWGVGRRLSHSDKDVTPLSELRPNLDPPRLRCFPLPTMLEIARKVSESPVMPGRDPVLPVSRDIGKRGDQKQIKKRIEKNVSGYFGTWVTGMAAPVWESVNRSPSRQVLFSGV